MVMFIYCKKTFSFNTRNVVVQLVAVERALDLLLASSENISPLSAQGRGPNKSFNVVSLKTTVKHYFAVMKFL